ncbi:uncharacterized protein LOC128886319 [Hylaeus anthracinus]|uniref:uncharacterized protein LOC128886319 n=1 Tax=Hylaeus anthracinus TaxID=313031 RepID=UPI0023B9B138|nr:uncharacterized protein LOC128886319 [Hylaeus anthracinus]
MLAVFCLLLVLGLGHCRDNDLPSKFEIESSINRTIEEVERQLRVDPSLPRLTRHEIVRILQNITAQDLKSFMDKEKLEKARKLYQRALMVVLPYNADESPGSLNDLYTKPPMTQMITDFLKSGNDKVEANINNDDASIPSTDENLVSYKTTPRDPHSTTTKSKYKNHRETYSEVRTKVPLKETLKLDSSPVRFTFNLENLQKNAQTTEETTTTRHPVYKNNGNEKLELEIVYSTSVTDQPTTKAVSKEIAIDLEKHKTSQNVLSSNQWRYNAPPSVALTPTMPSKFDKVPFLPTVNAEPDDRLTVSSSEKSGMPDKDSKIAEALIMSTQRPALYVTPMSTETSPKVKYSSTYTINSGGFRAATTTTSMPMRPEVMDLLASIGLKPDNSSNVEDVYKKNKAIHESKFQIPDTNSVLRATVSGLTSVGTDSASITKQNTFESPESEIKKGVDNLTPEVQLLFQRFGLQTSNLDRSTTTTQRTTINLNSYTNFKPLPTSSVKDKDMKEFLAKFGLGISDTRKQKSMNPTTEAPSLIEAVPGNMRGVLENMGLISTTRKAVRTTPKTLEDMESTETSKFHVFKPHEVDVDDKEQRSKINELLDTVRQVQEGKADIQKVRKAAKELLESAKVLKDGPDPLKLEEILRTYNDDVRNEIKRQQEPETTTETTIETTTETITETTTAAAEGNTTLTSMAATESTEATDSGKAGSDQSKSALTTSAPEVSSSTSNLAALEESFGGTTREPDPELPPRRKSGLYFLVDWNSFLEVGEEDKEKINLRFQPKVGDRSRFLSVTVP